MLTCHGTLQEDHTSFTIKCNIDNDVNHVSEGIKLGLKDDREKNSDKLGRLVAFTGSSVITKLPPYMTVQMVRFFYKVAAAQKAKILRKVTSSVVALSISFDIAQAACTMQSVRL